LIQRRTRIGWVARSRAASGIEYNPIPRRGGSLTCPTMIQPLFGNAREHSSLVVLWLPCFSRIVAFQERPAIHLIGGFLGHYCIPPTHHAIEKLLEGPERIRDARGHRSRQAVLPTLAGFPPSVFS
jgi:hypothetical protein